MAIDEGSSDEKLAAQQDRQRAKIVRVYSKKNPTHESHSVSACKAIQVDMDPHIHIQSLGKGKEPQSPDSQPQDMFSEKWVQQKKSLLKLLDKHSLSRVTATWEKQRFSSNGWLACRMAFWYVVFALPVIVYPMAIRIRDWSSRGARYLSSYSLALSNYCWLLGPSLGISIRYAVEAIIGQVLALANILFMNWAFHNYMTGGATASRIEAVDLAGVSEGPIYQSSWLPLCNLGNGPRFVETTTAGEFMRKCLFNIHWTEVDADVLKVIIVVVQTSLFVFFFLWYGFGQCVRLYALCYTLYWTMLFVNPAPEGQFSETPTVPWTQSIMTGVGAAIILLAQIVPRLNTALSKAEDDSKELTRNLKVLFGALPSVADEDVRIRMHSTLQVVRIALGNVKNELQAAWWEDMDLLCFRARRRRKLFAFAGTLEQLEAIMSAAVLTAETMTDAEANQILGLLPSFNNFCRRLAEVVDADIFAQLSDHECLLGLQKATQQLQNEFMESRVDLSPRVLAFALQVCSMSERASSAIEYAATSSHSQRFSLWGWLCEIASKMELPQTRNHPKHMRFVIRSTFVIMVAFCFGWIGLERAINAYESEAAVTICIIVANTTSSGFSLGLIMRRLNSAVIGIVIGQAVSQVLAVQTEFHATVFALFLLLFSGFCTFIIFHSREHGGITYCVLAIASAGLLPLDGIFREYGIALTSAANEHLAGTVKAAVFGGALMLMVDIMFYTSARELAKTRTLDSLTISWQLLAHFIDKVRGQAAEEPVPLAASMATVDELKHLIRQAENEPAQAGIQFPFALFESLEASFRSISRELNTLSIVLSSITGSVDELFEDSEEGVSQSVLKQLKALLASRFADIGLMLRDLFERRFVPADEDGDNSKAGRLRREILDKTYDPDTEPDDADHTEILMSSHISRMKTRFSQITPLPKTTWTCSCCKRRDLSKVLPDEFQDSDIQASYSKRIRFLQSLLSELRGTAEISRGSLPTQDGLSHIELLINVIQNIDTEVQKVCLVLAKQS
eukprot:TRINITY_DN3401_c0_g2_i2.p1 TRINITY_DN3401_c0_g2~~TRINITY_DN3401_c0_g2_i2.p1  ORF type:complete len:1020 (+),score=154.47 TRINITY_DN3401_c0_g2_i2:101-3160(+)